MVKTKKRASKKETPKKVSKEIVEVRPEQPKDQGDFKLKKENKELESKPIPKDPEVKPLKNPNDPVDTHQNEGYKRPSVTNVQHVYTKKQFEKLMEAYKIQNPAKYERKKSELERKLKEIK